MQKTSFRIWDNKRKILYHAMDLMWRIEGILDFDWGTYDDIIKKPSKKHLDAYYCARTLIDEKKYFLMQSTGVEDRNGTTLFEGDIVKVGPSYYEVVFNKNKGAYCMSKVNDTLEIPFWQLSDNDEKAELVGNIYENPELMKINK